MAEERDVLEHLVLDFMQMRAFAEKPFVIVRGEGIRLYDRENRSYIDGLSGVFVASLGYGNRAIVDSVAEQMLKLHFAPPLHGTNEKAIELAMALREFAPAGMSTFKFLSGGSEATEAALKLSRQYHKQTGHPRKFKVISRYGGYHGGTFGALSASGGRERKSVFEPLLPGFLHVHPPYCYRCPYGARPEDCGTVCARVVDQTIEAEDPETVAAVIMEPISISSAGFVVPPRDFFVQLRESCTRHNVLLIFDEIITGFGRLGERFGADYYGVMPDVICCGKGMSGGYAPLSAVLIKDEIWSAFLGRPEDHVEFHHGHTFGGNPVACTAGLAALKQIVDGHLVERAKEMGAYLREKVELLAEEFDFVGEVRGAGLLQGFEFAKDRQTRERFPASVKPGKLVEAAAMGRGLLARTGDEFIAFAPPLIVTREDVDEIYRIARESMAEVAPALARA